MKEKNDTEPPTSEVPLALDYETPRRATILSRIKAWADRHVALRFVGFVGFGAFMTLVPAIMPLSDAGATLAASYGVLVLLVALVIVAQGRLDQRVLLPSTRMLCGAVAVVCISGFIRVQSCPHATYLRLGPVLLPVAGKACNNAQSFRVWTWDAIKAALR